MTATVEQRVHRMYGPTLLIGLLGGLGVTVGASRPWATATSEQVGLPAIHATASGTDLAPVVGAFGFVILAAFGAVIATRGWVRRCLGALVAIASVVVLVAALIPGGSTDVLRSGLSAKGWSGGPYVTATQLWRWIVVACSLATTVAGAVTARFGSQWAVMGARYDAPGESAVVQTGPPDDLSEAEVWRAIDQGRDPTREG